jgi:hypothetical protein
MGAVEEEEEAAAAEEEEEGCWALGVRTATTASARFTIEQSLRVIPSSWRQSLCSCSPRSGETPGVLGGKYFSASLASAASMSSSCFWMPSKRVWRRSAAALSRSSGWPATWSARCSTAPSNLRNEPESPPPRLIASSRMPAISGCEWCAVRGEHRRQSLATGEHAASIISPSGSFWRSTSVAGSPLDVTSTRRPVAR